MSLQPSLNRLLAQRLLPHFDSRRLVDWSVEALEDGYETESLLILAGMDRDATPEREEYFRHAIEELGLAVSPDKNDLLKTYAFDLAKRVVRCQTDGELALRELQAIYQVSEFDSRYQAFYYLADDLESLRGGHSDLLTGNLRPDNVQETIREACKEFLSWEVVNINPHNWGAVYCFSCLHVDAPLEHKTWLGIGKTKAVCRLCGSEQVANFLEAEDRQRILAAAEDLGRRSG